MTGTSHFKGAVGNKVRPHLWKGGEGDEEDTVLFILYMEYIYIYNLR